MPDADLEAQSRARSLAEHVAAHWERSLGSALLGAYLIGSLGHGGFNRRYSDIDLALVTEEGISEEQITAAREEAQAFDADLAAKLSLFWTDRGFSKGRFPPLDRLDYLDHAAVLMERERVDPKRPSKDEIRAYLRGRPFETWAARAEGFAVLDALEPADRKPYLRAHLYPARFVYSWMTGNIASNDRAVTYLGDHLPEGLALDPIQQALKCRLAAGDPDGLFGLRIVLPGQVEAVKALIEG